ncbi:MAG: hypothetical protein JXM74_03900 [Fusobacteriaceae bacterium]|nr:hypothetical protein [Fusobacteriaceae bacterium]
MLMLNESTKNSFLEAKYKAKIKRLTERLKQEIDFSVEYPDIEIFDEIKETRLKLKEAKEVLGSL